MYMLDTNTCIYIIKRRPKSVQARFRRIDPGQICISVATLAELQYGVERSSAKALNQSVLVAFVANLAVLAWTVEAAIEYGKLRCRLERQGTPIGNMDLIIAAHAKSGRYTLVTHNLREFNRVPGLKCQNWVEGSQASPA